MVTLTELAASKVKTNLERRGQGIGIRVGVKTTGCSGLAYVLEFVDAESANDLKFTSHGVDVFVDPKSLVYINGITMDWQKRGLNEGFEFINPQERDRCGCGESFRV